MWITSAYSFHKGVDAFYIIPISEDWEHILLGDALKEFHMKALDSFFFFSVFQIV